jgi:UDP-N-acetylmuramate--alanine ligase
MSGLAELLKNLGYEVSGSDLASGETVERLQALGCQVTLGHDPMLVAGKDLVVVSSAVRPTNPEWQEARRRGIPVLRRGAMLAQIMRLVKTGIAVAGTHGKTTTTSLIAHVLTEAGLDPTFVVGGRLRTLRSHARLGMGDVLVAEADESDGSFLEMLPTIAVVTNVDREHMDHFGSLESLYEEFTAFANQVPFYGTVVACSDDPGVRRILAGVERRVVTYGTDAEAVLRAEDVRAEDFSSRFRIRAQGEDLGDVRLNLPGRHNVLNALAAVAVARELEVPVERIRHGLESFPGVSRRLDRRRRVGGVTLLDDYGHHPTEIRAVVETLRALWRGRILCIFQPHRYSRVKDLGEAFAPVFRGVDLVAVLRIYPAGESPLPGVESRNLVAPIARESDTEVVYADDLPELVRILAPRLRPGDLLVTLGAGDVWKWGEAVLDALEARGGKGRKEHAETP